MKWNINKVKVGERIFNIRNSLNLTLEQFGKEKEINAERSNVSKWERGATLPNRSRLEIIAKKGNITVNELLYGSPDEFLDNNIDILFSNLDNNTGFFKNVLNMFDRGVIKLELSEILDINNLSNVDKQFKNIVDDHLSHIKSENRDMINYLKQNYDLSCDTFNILYGGGFFGDVTTYELNSYLLKKDILLPTEEDLKEFTYTKDFDSFINLFNDEFINLKFKGVLEGFYLIVKNKQKDFNGSYDQLSFISIDFKTFLTIPDYYTFDVFNEVNFNVNYTDFFPYKPNKYKITGFNDVIGLYMNDTDTTYFLANYKDKNCIPLNTEAKYFILNHDNSYQITKITEIPNCKYIAPIIGKLE